MIPELTIARVRESVDLVELVRESVPTLKKSGRNFQARCPFHQERTPSFNVNPEMGVFKCFGCGVGGDVFKFVMLTESLSYPEAIRKLAQRAGIEIEEEKREVVSEEAKAREALYALLEEAARFYSRTLAESSEASVAREYMLKRGVTQETLSRFSIGFAPQNGHALRDAALRKGYPLELLVQAGLVRTKEDSGRTHDHFWNRIIFPIWDAQGRIVAFGGRAMGDAMPKYINSPETPVYSKSRHLYGLFQGMATLRKRRHVVVLEGYMDVAVCHQYGADFTVATLGTALTEDHLRLLRRYADRVTLLFDPDAAGAAATLRGGELLIASGFQVDVVTLPDELDPDEILVRDGRAALDRELENAVSFMDYFLARALHKQPALTPEAKLAVAREVLPLVQKLKDPILQDEHLGRLANALRVDKAVLGQQAKRLKPNRESSAKAAPAVAPVAREKEILDTEEEMLLLAILYPSEPIARLLAPVEWKSANCAAAWDVIKGDVSRGAVNVSERLGMLSDDEARWLTQLALRERNYPDPAGMLDRLLAGLQRQHEAVQLQMLKQDIDAMIEGRKPMDAQKVQFYNDLSKRLKGSRPATEAPLHG